MQPPCYPGDAHAAGWVQDPIIYLLGKAAELSFGNGGRINRSLLCCGGLGVGDSVRVALQSCTLPVLTTQVQRSRRGCCRPQLLPKPTRRLAPDPAWIGARDLEVNCSISHIQSPTEFIFQCGRSKAAVRSKSIKGSAP